MHLKKCLACFPVKVLDICTAHCSTIHKEDTCTAQAGKNTWLMYSTATDGNGTALDGTIKSTCVNSLSQHGWKHIHISLKCGKKHLVQVGVCMCETHVQLSESESQKER